MQGSQLSGECRRSRDFERTGYGSVVHRPIHSGKVGITAVIDFPPMNEQAVRSQEHSVFFGLAQQDTSGQGKVGIGEIDPVPA